MHEFVGAESPYDRGTVIARQAFASILVDLAVAGVIRRDVLDKLVVRPRRRTPLEFKMSDETSLDITGVGKLAKAIPAKAWAQIVDTACTTFRQVVAPVTALTSGVGRLLDAKFDALLVLLCQ